MRCERQNGKSILSHFFIQKKKKSWTDKYFSPAKSDTAFIISQQSRHIFKVEFRQEYGKGDNLLHKNLDTRICK